MCRKTCRQAQRESHALGVAGITHMGAVLWVPSGQSSCFVFLRAQTGSDSGPCQCACTSFSQDGFQHEGLWEVGRTYYGLAPPPVFCFCFLFFWLHHTACGILVPQPGIEPVPPPVGAWSPNHWTAREFPPPSFFDP